MKHPFDIKLRPIRLTVSQETQLILGKVKGHVIQTCPTDAYHRHWWELRELEPRSPLKLRHLLEDCAWLFKREFGYDFAQYAATEDYEDPRDKLFLWTASDYDRDNIYGVGGAVFRWREWSNAPHGSALSWVWLHPYFRNQKILTMAWPLFIERMGTFYVEPPYSNAMSAFLLKHNHSDPVWREQDKAEVSHV